MAPPKKDTTSVTFRIPSAWLAEADAVAKILSRPGIPTGRTDAFRAAMARGFEIIRDDAEQKKRGKSVGSNH